MMGNFVTQKSAKKFSLIAKDQAHEPSNKILQAHIYIVVHQDCMKALKLSHSSCWLDQIVHGQLKSLKQPTTSHRNSTAHHA